MKRVICFYIIVLLFGYKSGNAQISAPSSALAEPTDYREGAKEELIYTFVSQGTGTPLGSLFATAPEGTDSCNYTWTRFNPLTHLFDIPLVAETGVGSSTLSDLVQGGYQVHIQRTDSVDTTFRAWVYTHVISLDVLETSEGKVFDNKFTCEYVELNASLGYDTLVYANPATGTKRYYFIKPTVNWDYSNEKESKSGAFTGTYVRNYDPPAYDTYYIAIASDRSGVHDEDSVFYETIQTEANFSFRVKDGQDPDFRDPLDEESAPLEVEFINSSVNGSQFTWVLTDTIFGKQKKQPPVVTTDTADRPRYTYYYPHSYVVTLYSKSPEGCIDSVNNEKALKIKKSKLSVPNYFCINGEQGNSRFDINRKDRYGNPFEMEFFATLKSFHITIFTRQGKKVHEFEGDINDWEGWDGKIGALGIYGSDGVYYYVIEAVGYDGIVYKGEGAKQTDGTGTTPGTTPTTVQYTGFLYLFKNCGDGKGQ
ncbi:MAG: gliding motility-associated C-terminal domain-containing protein [Bacteroidales bacterium]